MKTTLVFLHGRGQEFKDAEELRHTWLAGLRAGMTRAGLPAAALDTTPSVLPFYGNVLFSLTAELARDPLELESMPATRDEPAPLHPYLPEDVGRLEQRLLYDMRRARDAAGTERSPQPAETELEAADLEGLAPWAREAGRQALSWGVARQSLLFLARHTRFDQEIIAAHLRDVAVYLTRGRERVLATVRAGLPAEGSLTLVTHSLGTVVGCDLLADDDVRGRTRLWVTAGSPLGLEAVQHNLRPRGPHPVGVDWLTMYDPQDVVALGHPLRSWGVVRNVRVDNGDRPHAIDRYLAHPDVARAVAAAVTADRSPA